MLVVCPHCEQESNDSDFCDHCNGEIATPGPQHCCAPASVTLGNGQSLDCGVWAQRWPDDAAAFFLADLGGTSLRVHGIGPQNWPALKADAMLRAECALSCLPRVEVIEHGGGAIIAAEVISRNSHFGIEVVPRSFSGDWLVKLEEVAEASIPLANALRALHSACCLWLNFDLGSLEMDHHDLHITNLDLGLYRFGTCPDELRVSPRFSPPEVCSFAADKIGASTDVYHFAAVLYYCIAGLPNGFPGLGLSAFSHEFPPLRVFQPSLPPGIAPVIHRALSRDTSVRHATIDGLVSDLCQAIQRARDRYSFSAASGARAAIQGPLSRIWQWFRWPKPRRIVGIKVDIAGRTIAGPAKSALGCSNQDEIAFGGILSMRRRWARDFEPATYAVVADGVSTARVGSGEIASHIACSGFEEAFQSANYSWTERSNFERAALERAQVVSETIVRHASESANIPPDVRESDLMSTTAVLAVCSGDQLHVANIGDSRLYLVTKDFVELLTIDGDVATSQLTANTPPEQIAEMGHHGKALRFCLGAAQLTLDNTFVSDMERSSPQCSHWPVMCGDVVILCSDGLIEDGVFLDPDDAWDIIQQHAEAAADEVVELLVAAAAARQRVPSAAEPHGFGDNIACVVIKVS